MDSEEEAYLIDIVNKHFKRQLTTQDVLWSYSGVRPLCDDESDSPSAITRDYTLEVQADEQGQAPILSIFGGKITTYRRLSESALAAIAKWYPEMKASWTASAPLPGGDMNGDLAGFIATATTRYPWVPVGLLRRLATAYGTRIAAILGDARSVADLGVHVGADLYEAEVRYLVTQEWADTAEDILWRRSKLGLFVATDGRACLEGLLQERLAGWRLAAQPPPALAQVG
jgi:glycerol-3-phosphate dehydrogenase